MPEIAHRYSLEPTNDAGGAPFMETAGVRVEALALLGHVLIQLPPGKVDDRLLSALGLIPPSSSNRAAGLDPTLMWLGPRAWVAITGTVNAAASLAASVAAGLRHVGGNAVNLSDAHQSIRITGPAATTLLAQGCALDLGSASFTEGSATRTSIAKMPSILHRTAAEVFLLHVDRSLASQLWVWLDGGIREMTALAGLSRNPVS
ncbi:MAG: hypothetical protein IPM02_25775 [Betaproteobacteria bacterium]|nr:hypothetical protein [Betaproteobacteria bacterium]